MPHFSVIDLIPCACGIYDETDPLDLRSNPSQKGRDNNIPLINNLQQEQRARAYKKTWPLQSLTCPIHIDQGGFEDLI